MHQLHFCEFLPSLTFSRLHLNPNRFDNQTQDGKESIIFFNELFNLKVISCSLCKPSVFLRSANWFAFCFAKWYNPLITDKCVATWWYVFSWSRILTRNWAFRFTKLFRLLFQITNTRFLCKPQNETLYLQTLKSIFLKTFFFAGISFDSSHTVYQLLLHFPLQFFALFHSKRL